MEIRFTAWLLWRIHLAFRQMGVGGGMGAQFALAFLKSLPFGLVLELAEASQEAFTWLAEHFPDVDRENPGLERQGVLQQSAPPLPCVAGAVLTGIVRSAAGSTGRQVGVRRLTDHGPRGCEDLSCRTAGARKEHCWNHESALHTKSVLQSNLPLPLELSA